MRTTTDIVHELRTHASLGFIDLDTVRQIVNPQELGPPREVVGFGMPEPKDPNYRKRQHWDTYTQALSNAVSMYEWAKSILDETGQITSHTGKIKYKDWMRTSAASGIAYIAGLCVLDALELRITGQRSNLYQVQDYRKFIYSLPEQYEPDYLALVFGRMYDNLHVYGYYRHITYIDVIDFGMTSAQTLINAISGHIHP